MNHTEECQKRQENLRLALDRFESEHPNYCHRCGGAGGTEYYSYRDGYDFVDCPDCLGQGRCPLCGADLGEQDCDYGKCNCGWSINGKSETAPWFDPDCECLYPPEAEYDFCSEPFDIETYEQIIGRDDYDPLDVLNRNLATINRVTG